MGGALLGDWLAINRWVVTNCAVHHLSFLGFINLPFLLSYQLHYYHYYYNDYSISMIKVFSSQPMSFLTFILKILSPIPQ